MHEYDVALKRILTSFLICCASLSTSAPSTDISVSCSGASSSVSASETITGASSLRWLNVERPLVRNLRVDLLGESPDGELIHIELQSRNERGFPFRMREYSFAVALRHGRLPRQVALYAGAEPLRMPAQVHGPGGTFRYHLMDIRQLDGELLLASKDPGDNIVAILTRLGGKPDAVRRVLDRIEDGPPDLRDEALAELSILAGLRKLTGEVEREAMKVPIQESIRNNDYYGPLIRQERARGNREILASMTRKKFGAISPETRKRLDALGPRQIRTVALRLLDAQRIEDLFAR